jgi:hypothetical protein
MGSAVALAASKLPNLGNPKDPKYKTLTQNLILQGLIKLDDSEVREKKRL